nr:DUF2254 family protein [Arthrobacter sp. Edens01]
MRAAAMRYRFAESLFLLPALLMLAGIALAVSAAALDRALGHDAPIPLTLAMSSNAATWLLATVAGAMITTVGVVFSLTVVSLQLASGQFSPRVMRSFIRDRLSQGVIGLLVGTFFYCILILPSLSGNPAADAPRISLTLAVVLTLVTVVGIIAHLDHLSRGLQVGNLARAIAAEGGRVAAELDKAPAGLQAADPRDFHPPADAAVICCPVSGWVSQVDSTRLLSAVPPGTTVRLESRIGAYVHADEPLLSVWPAPSRESRQELAGAIEVADARTMLQDADSRSASSWTSACVRSARPSTTPPLLWKSRSALEASFAASSLPRWLRKPSGTAQDESWCSHGTWIMRSTSTTHLTSCARPAWTSPRLPPRCSGCCACSSPTSTRKDVPNVQHRCTGK